MGATQTKNMLVKLEGDHKHAPWTRENSMGWTKTKGNGQADELSVSATCTLDTFFPGAQKGKTTEIHAASILMKNGFE